MISLGLEIILAMISAVIGGLTGGVFAFVVLRNEESGQNHEASRPTVVDAELSELIHQASSDWAYVHGDPDWALLVEHRLLMALEMMEVNEERRWSA
jgi:hypothetical protein